MENKTSKYFKYAIGEIVLVVIGILLALQINNWNENRKANNEEVAILESLQENLVLAKSQSEALIIKEREAINNLILVLNIDSLNETDKAVSLTNEMVKSAVWNIEESLPVINRYSELKSSNKLGLIKNQTIKEKFTSLEVSLNNLQSLLEDRMTIQQLRIDDISVNDLNFILFTKGFVPGVTIEREPPNDYSEILKNLRIRNLLGIKLFTTQDVLNDRISLDKEIKELMVSIGTELDKRR